MTDLIIGLDPDRHADHRLRALRDPHGRRRPGGAPGRRTRSASCTWRPGWRVCLATPSWPDGLAVRARDARGAARGAGETWPASASTCVAAIEYEIRIWARRRRADCRAGSATAWTRCAIRRASWPRSCPALDGLGVGLSAVHTEAGAGPPRAQHRARAGPPGGRRRRAPEVRRQAGGGVDGPACELPRQDGPGEEGSSGHIHLSLLGRTRRTRSPRPSRARPCRRVFASRWRACSSTCRRPRSCSTRPEFLQAAGPGLVRPDQRELGLREPLVRRARRSVRDARSCCEARMPAARSGREPVPRARGAGRVGRRRHPAPARAAGRRGRRRVRAGRPARRCPARSSRAIARVRRGRRSCRGARRAGSATTTSPRAELGAEGLAGDRDGLGARALRTVGMTTMPEVRHRRLSPAARPGELLGRGGLRRAGELRRRRPSRGRARGAPAPGGRRARRTSSSSGSTR